MPDSANCTAVKFLAIGVFKTWREGILGMRREVEGGLCPEQGKACRENQWRTFRRLSERGRGVTRGLLFYFSEETRTLLKEF